MVNNVLVNFWNIKGEFLSISSGFVRKIFGIELDLVSVVGIRFCMSQEEFFVSASVL